MSTADRIGFSLFALFGLTFIVSVFYEFFGARRFVKKLYFLGLKLINIKEEWGDVEFQPFPEPKETNSGFYKIINNKQILFRYHQPLFSFQVNTPLPFKGVVEINDGIAHISGRIPIAQSVFLGFWLFGWTAGGLGVSIFAQGNNRLVGLAMLLGGYLFLGAMLGYGYILEKRRLMIVLDELKAKIGIPNDTSNTRINEGFISFEWKNTIAFVIVIFALVQGGHYWFFSSALKKVTKSSEPQKLRLKQFENAFSLGKNSEVKEKLASEYSRACEDNRDYTCRLLGYIYEVDKKPEIAYGFYRKSCSNLDPHSCYNLLSNKKYATENDLAKVKSILDPICNGKDRESYKTCCECYDQEKKKSL